MPAENPPRVVPPWAPLAAALLGAASVALAEPSAADFGEVLEGWAAGSSGAPWLRVRAVLLVLGTWLPIGTLALRMGLVVALVHGALAALVARRTVQAHASSEALLGGCGVLAGALAASFPVAFDAVRAPSAASLGVVVLLLSLEAPTVASAFAAGLLLALDPILLLVGAVPLWFRLRGAPWRTTAAAFGAGALPLALAAVPGRALYTFPLVRPGGWATPSAAWSALAHMGWAAVAVAGVGLVLSVRRGGDTPRGVFRFERVILLGLGGLLAVASGPILGRGALILVSVLVAEAVASAVWLGGSLLVLRRIPLARASVGFALLLLLAWPLSRLDAAVGHPTDARVANAAVELPLLSSVPERSILLFRDDLAERHALAAQAMRGLSATVDVLPIRHVEAARVREAIGIDPALAPVVRETLLAGAPSEFVLANLAAQRPTFVEVAPSMPKAIAKHLMPAGALFRFDAEPRAASDRAGALDAQKRARELAASRAPLSADHGLRLIRASRRLAVALAATGEKESATRGVDQLRAVAGDEALVSLLLRKSVLQGTPVDLGDIVLEE